MAKQNWLSQLLCGLGRDVFTVASTNEALDRTYEQAMANFQDFDVEHGKVILFSDHHRGADNRANDFKPSERAYCAALSYYYEKGYSLGVIGDAEELWEERPENVLPYNQASFEREKQFHAAGRYFRLWGNHDEIWGKPDQVRGLLQKYYGEKPLQVPESFMLRVVKGEKVLGWLFIIHGHQGTQNEGDKTYWSKFILHNVWRPIQAWTGISCNTPARNWKLRNEHDQVMYNWAAQKTGLVLLAGHTHAPVFASRSHHIRLREALREARHRLSELAPEEGEYEKTLERIARLSAELTWISIQTSDEAQDETQGLDNSRPCYFNTGCCCFSDGDITGIEIADGQIRLVRWPDDTGFPSPKTLEQSALSRVLSLCK